MNEDAINIAKNLRRIMNFYGDKQQQAAKKCGLAQKTISNLLNPNDSSTPNLKKLAEVAKGYKVETWMLLMPDVPLEILLNHQFKKHIENYLHADKPTRDYINHIFEGPSSYSKKINE